MIFVDVEGEVSAASMVKDSKIYIEIAKFVQAYEAIVSDPNKFLVDIDERPIDTEKEVLTWDQFVDIATNCDLGFTPKPDAQMLAVYYSYAMQIGSISKEVKRIATVEDIAEAQKKYYNFIDDTTIKVENQYKKQHEIASRRAREAAHVEKNISNKKLKLVGVFAAMAFGVFLCGLGLAGMFFDIGFVKFFGFERTEVVERIEAQSLSCIGVSEIKLPNTIEYIGEEAFRENVISGELDFSNLTNLVHIGESAFYDNKITSVTLSSSVAFIGEMAFYSYIYDEENDEWNNLITNVYLGNPNADIGCDAFGWAGGIKTHNLPETYGNNCGGDV